MPCEDNDLRNRVLDRNQFANAVQADERLNADVEGGLVSIIEREVRLQRDLERFKRELASFVTYTSLAAYHDVERYEGKIDTVNLDGFFRSLGHYASDLELLSIIRRMDADGDATITLQEWSDFLRPNAALAPVPPPLPTYVPRSYYYDPIYYPSYHLSYPSYSYRSHLPYYYDSPYHFDRLYHTPYYSSLYTSPYRYRSFYY